jgi:hypothetical protein
MQGSNGRQGVAVAAVDDSAGKDRFTSAGILSIL